MGHEIKSFSNIIEIKPNVGGFTLNDSLMTTGLFKDSFKRKIKADPNFIVLYHPVDDNMPFSEYFSVLSGASEAIDEIRNEYSQDKYGKAYKELDYEQEIQVKEALPFNLVELTPQLLQAIESENGHKTRVKSGE